MVDGNLFWQTRRLTQLREDHLTYFLASALECDTAFREGYQELLLGGLAAAGAAPRIARVQAQAAFGEQRCRQDLLLILDDWPTDRLRAQAGRTGNAAHLGHRRSRAPEQVPRECSRFLESRLADLINACRGPLLGFDWRQWSGP